MTQDDLIASVYDELSARKNLAGKARVRRIIARSIKAWPAPVLMQCDDAQTEVVGKYFARSMERQERAEYGMGFFASIILAAIISEIVKVLIRRWLENRTEMMEALR